MFWTSAALGCSSVTRGSLSSNAQIESREGAFDRSLREPFGLRAERKQSGDPLHHLTEPPPHGIVERHAAVPVDLAATDRSRQQRAGALRRKLEVLLE